MINIGYDGNEFVFHFRHTLISFWMYTEKTNYKSKIYSHHFRFHFINDKIDCDWKWTSFSSPRNLTPVLDEPDIKLRFTLITSGFISSIKFLLIAIRSLTSGIIQPQVYSVNIRSETTIKTTSGFISSMINIHRNDAKLIFQFRNISIPSGLIR